MNKLSTKHITLLFFALMYSCTTFAYRHWCEIEITKGDSQPVIKEYMTTLQEAPNGKSYNRISGPSHSQYGYEMTDDKILMYDYEKNEELVAFDFSLTEGDHFTTINGMEWEIATVKDTTLNISPWDYKEEHKFVRKLFNVKTLDGKYADQWLEGAGSFTNLFMTADLEDIDVCQVMWLEYEHLTKGSQWLDRNINMDPIYTFTDFKLSGYNAPSDDEEGCYYDNNSIVFNLLLYDSCGPNYFCFHRSGDEIHLIKLWDLEPADCIHRMIYNFVFDNLPAPESGTYTFNVFGKVLSVDVPTGINKFADQRTQSGITFDTQGKRMAGNIDILPAGIYLVNGKKVVKQ